MNFMFRPAIREEVALLIGLIGPSGGGKTYSAMRLAKGICGDKPFAVIDTEAGRAKHYADLFKFDHGDLKAPFRPEVYIEAIKVADEAGYKAIIVDSHSHEWAGEGGILDWQEEELYRMAKDDWQKREACKMASWIKPKMAHKQMIQRFLQIRANLILCFRAEEKIEMKKIDGKMQIVPRGFQPICSKELPYELTVSFLLTPDKPGIPQPIKLQEQHKPLFPLDKQINEDSGKKISEWARGEGKTNIIKQPPEESDIPSPEEEQEALRERGMTQFKDPELTPFEKYKADMSQATTREEVSKVFKEFVKIPHSKEILDQAAQLANDKQIELKKK